MAKLVDEIVKNMICTLLKIWLPALMYLHIWILKKWNVSCIRKGMYTNFNATLWSLWHHCLALGHVIWNSFTRLWKAWNDKAWWWHYRWPNLNSNWIIYLPAYPLALNCNFHASFICHSMYVRGLTKFWNHSGVWPKVSLVFEDFKFKISEG